MKKPLIVYHKNCDDGFGAAYAAWKKLGDTAEYLPLDFNDDLARADFAGRDVTALDFAFNPEDAQKYLLPVVKSLTVVDHHLSAMDSWCKHLGVAAENGQLRHRNGKLDLFFDLDKSGAYLAWEHFHAGEKLPRMLAHISDIDLWRFELDGTRDFSTYLRAQPRDFAVWDKICRQMESESADGLLATGQAINGFYNRQLEGIVGAGRESVIELEDGNGMRAKGIAINASKLFASDLGNILAVKSGSFAVIWETDGRTAYCSMRSVPAFDSIPFARAEGGGGHPQACGFTMPLDRFLPKLGGKV